MGRDLFHSQPLVFAVLALFIALLGAETLPQDLGQAQSEFQKVFQAGKKLYNEGEHKEAIPKLLVALNLAKAKEEMSEACFYLALCYYALGESEACSSYLKKLFEAQPEREIEALNFPSGFMLLFFQAKNEAAKQAPLKAGMKVEEKKAEPGKKAEPEKKVQEAEKKPEAIGGKAEPGPQVKKKGKFPWLIVGGIVVVGGVVAVLLLTKKKSPAGSSTGSISVSSTPGGAKVYLDGSDTGLTTACTVNNVSAGSHTVKLVKEGYRDYQQNVTVTAGQTAAVTATLTTNTIAVTSPSGGAIWVKTVEYTIQWTTDSTVKTSVKASQAFPLVRLTSSRDGVSSSANQGGMLKPLSITQVNIELYKGGTNVLTIASNTPNDLSEKWTVPASLAAGTDYKIRVACATDTSVYGESGAFSIAEPVGNISISSNPTGAKVFLDGNDTGQRTSCALTNIPIGTHSLRLTLEDYGQWQGSVDVLGGQTANVSVSLAGYTYEFVTKWGSQGTGDGQFNLPIFIAVDGSDNVYITDSKNNRIQKFISNGIFLAKWGSPGTGDGQFNEPNGVAVDMAGAIYVSDDNHWIQKFASDGSFLAKWGGYPGWCGVFGVAAGNSGFVYEVISAYNFIEKSTPDGTLVTRWGSQGTDDGQFDGPYGIALDGSGYIYITEVSNHRVQKFTAGGAFVTKWGSQGSQDGQFKNPTGIAADKSGYVYVADENNNRIQKFTSSGAFITKWGGPGISDGKFITPEGVAVDSSGYVYVADSNNHRIQKFRMVTAANQPAGISYTPIQKQE